MIRKTEKIFNNTHGIEEIYTLPINRPIILGIVPGGNSRELNGYLNTYSYLLQLRKFSEVDSSYDISNVPFDIIIADSNDKVDEYIFNIIPSNNVSEAKKLMRNINIISYCYGNNKTGTYLKRLYLALIEKGYNEDETKEILSQIFVLQIVDNYFENKQNSKIPYATVVTVQDVFDLENPRYYNEEQVQSKFIHNPFIKVLKEGQNDRYVLYKSFGEESLSQTLDEHRFGHDYISAPIINSIMGLYLIKLLNMSLNNIEIKDNIDISSHLNLLLAKVQQFVMKKNKDYNDFTKDELKELNLFLMQEIKKLFKEYIPAVELSKEEKDYLDEKENCIQELTKLNREVGIEYKIPDIERTARLINDYYDNYGDNDIIYTLRNNGGLEFNVKKEDAIKEKVEYLFRSVNILINALYNLRLPDNLSMRMQNEINSWIKSVLAMLKNIVDNDKMHKIIDEYCDKECLKISL